LPVSSFPEFGDYSSSFSQRCGLDKVLAITFKNLFCRASGEQDQTDSPSTAVPWFGPLKRDNPANPSEL
jgi:hypothetical protein